MTTRFPSSPRSFPVPVFFLLFLSLPHPHPHLVTFIRKSRTSQIQHSFLLAINFSILFSNFSVILGQIEIEKINLILFLSVCIRVYESIYFQTSHYPSRNLCPAISSVTVPLNQCLTETIRWILRRDACVYLGCLAVAISSIDSSNSFLFCSNRC